MRAPDAERGWVCLGFLAVLQCSELALSGTRRADNFRVARQFQTSFAIAAAPELNFGNFEPRMQVNVSWIACSR
jgi:hypothetical protein